MCHCHGHSIPSRGSLSVGLASWLDSRGRHWRAPHEKGVLELARMGMAVGELSHTLPLQSSSIFLVFGTFTVGRSNAQTWTRRHLCSRNRILHRFFFLVSCRGVHGVGLVRRGEADHLAWRRVLPCFSQELRQGSPPLSVQNEAEQCVSIKRTRKKKTGGKEEGRVHKNGILQSAVVSFSTIGCEEGPSLIDTNQHTHRHVSEPTTDIGTQPA